MAPKIRLLIPDPSVGLGYSYQTTFWLDFDIADHFGPEAIKETFENAFQYAKNNYMFVTELSLVMNWRCWGWFDKKNNELSELYRDLFYKIDNYCYDNLKGEELDYYFRTTD